MDIFEDFEMSERGALLVKPLQASWALHAATMIDDHSPGFLAALVRSRGAHRHAMHAVLAASLRGHLDRLPELGVSSAQEGALRALGETLPLAKPRQAIESAFQLSSFTGLGTLARLVEPLQPDDYVQLIEVLSDPAERHRRNVLQHIPRIDHDRLRAVLALDPALCVVRIARKVRREQQARVANDVLAVVRGRRPDLTERELREYAGQADQHSPLHAQLERLLALVKELPHLPFDEPRDFRYLRSVAQFEDCGRRFRNCIASKFLDALSGRVIWLEYLPRPAIAALLPTSQGYMLSKIHGPGNAPVFPDLVEEVRSALSKFGVPVITPAPVAGPLASVRFALMKYDPFCFGPDEWDHSAPELD
ncbi:hypothetical protein ACO2Q0_01670 [Phenylobacterium sp. VNQ135]|uniref:hypothetical protein n=1 Tax=Phenylobacterium sp. VNQ135 TaxID=3400922 RepID=UPI003C01D0B8